MMLFIFLVSMFWTEDFSSKESAMSNWQGDWSHLTINAHQELQNNTDSSATSVLLRPSTASINAEWAFYTRIYGGTSNYNLTRFYILTSDSINANGYYIQVGGNNDNISLYGVYNGTSTKLIENADRLHILPENDAEIYVRLTRAQDGIFHLYSLVENVDLDYVEEGAIYTEWLAAQSVGIMMKNSSQRGHDLYFDDIVVSGEQQTQPTNSPTSKIQLTLRSDYLSLNHEGSDSEIHIDYTGAEETYKVSMKIYSDDGRWMNTCYEAQEMNTAGTLTWKGEKKNGEKVQIGLYVIIVEITSDAHQPIRQRYAVAVGM